ARDAGGGEGREDRGGVRAQEVDAGLLDPVAVAGLGAQPGDRRGELVIGLAGHRHLLGGDGRRGGLTVPTLRSPRDQRVWGDGIGGEVDSDAGRRHVRQVRVSGEHRSRRPRAGGRGGQPDQQGDGGPEGEAVSPGGLRGQSWLDAPFGESDGPYSGEWARAHVRSGKTRRRASSARRPAPAIASTAPSAPTASSAAEYQGT